MRGPRVLLIQDASSSELLPEGLSGKQSLPGIELERVTGMPRAMRHLEERHYDLVLYSPGVEPVNGLSLLRNLRARQSGVPVMVLSESHDIHQAIEVMKMGAIDYLVKKEAASPDVLTEKILDAIERSQGTRSASDEVRMLRQLSFTDSLTGLFNRRYLFQAIDREKNRSERSKSPLAFAMVDIDLFKAINDRHGHLAGDAILQRFALYLRSWVRTMDIVCRYGGDEFGVILPMADSQEAIEVAKRLCFKLGHAVFPCEGLRIRLSVSIGVSATDLNPSMEGIELIHLADKALFRAKNRGRNQISLWAERKDAIAAS